MPTNLDGYRSLLSRQEIAIILPEFQGLRRLMFLIMYGAGLRHKECRRLRVKDVCFDFLVDSLIARNTGNQLPQLLAEP